MSTRSIVRDLAWHRDEGHVQRLHRGKKGSGRSAITFIAPNAAQRPHGALAREWLDMPHADINHVLRSARARVGELQRDYFNRDVNAEAVRARMAEASTLRKAPPPPPPLKPYMEIRALDLLRRLTYRAHFVCDQRGLAKDTRLTEAELVTDIRTMDSLRRHAWRARLKPSIWLPWSWSKYLQRVVDDPRCKTVAIQDTMRAWARAECEDLRR